MGKLESNHFACFMLLTLKEHPQPKHRLSHLHEERDIDSRLENPASAYLSKDKTFSDHTSRF